MDNNEQRRLPKNVYRCKKCGRFCALQEKQLAELSRRQEGSYAVVCRECHDKDENGLTSQPGLAKSLVSNFSSFSPFGFSFSRCRH